MTATIAPSMNSSGQARMSRTLQLLKDAEQADNFGESTGIEIGRRYEMDLSIYEDWICTKFLLSLSKEEKAKCKNCYWSVFEEEQEAMMANADDDDLFGAVEKKEFVVPAKWLRDAPHEGEFQFTYVVQNPEKIK